MSSLNPCNECPFRRASAPGWLGAHKNAMEIVNIIRADQKFPCHKDVLSLKDYLKFGLEDQKLKVARCEPAPALSLFEEAVRDARHCVGALAFMNNTAKRSRDPVIARQQNVVGKRKDVFDRAEMMEAHHNRWKRK